MSGEISLLTGDYYIQMHDEPRRFVGVDPRLPMYPHPLCALPEGQQPLWHIQNLDDVRYVIRQHHAATIVQGDSVVSQLTHIPQQWIVQHVPSEGQFCFLILNNYPGEQEDTVWSLDSSDPYTRVKLGKVRWRGLRIPVGMPKGSLFNLLPLVNVGTGAPQHSGGPLRDGRYLIKKHGLNGGFIAVDEESSEDPISRPVFVLPGGTKAPIWRVHIHDVTKGVYSISSGDWITGSGNGRVVALRAPFMPQQWRLQSLPLEGENCYMVHSGAVSDNPTWAVESSKPYTQVDLRKIGPFAPEDPPQDALFDFIPIPEDKEASIASIAAPGIVVELPAGRYRIKRHDSHDGYIAVKNSAEELRPVVVLPGGTQAPVWNIAAPNFGTYEISSEGFDTQPKGDVVVAGGISIQQGRWHLHRLIQQGKNCYMIIDESNTSLQWAVTKPEPYAPVELRDIGVFTPESPPKDALFDIIPVPDDDTSTEPAAPKIVPLPIGEYLIKKHGAHSDYIAVKDGGADEFRPVITLPAGTQAPKWNIGSANIGRYEITSGGQQTHPVRDKIVAGGFSIMQGQWFLRHYSLKGQFCYMIVSDIDPNMGWAITQTGAFAPVEFKEVGFFAPELPPPEFLFDLIPVKRD
ncbi:hypothetical protein PHLGIDRAFT_19483 [Phlebiopsis gigantea 11061_1 CR5-6]|uniref:Uncharacterized protein n=1 Tax=Phlebiopsis gigantea (strain 11061_1 CR5-6) TaxID=745531 RepID=A0A0C3S9L8_PHLG1|nr:hypothetical protein PHLGIDRAFT_19483 [Phlebiopsis gigantea 11061_1 CR5-6]